MSGHTADWAHGLRKAVAALATVAAIGLAHPAMAASEPVTRLVTCPSGNCLLIAGHRDNAASEVDINGHAVRVEGRRNWRVSVPVETIRQWSAPYARTVEVTLRDAQMAEPAASEVDLPLGLFGRLTNLASLIVRAP